MLFRTGVQPPSFPQPGRCIHALLCRHNAEHRPAQSERAQAERADDDARLQAQREGLQRRRGLRTAHAGGNLPRHQVIIMLLCYLFTKLP